MTRKTWGIVALLAIWLGACYALRCNLMENTHWVDACEPGAQLLACDVRRGLGLVIHFGVLAWASLSVAVLAWLLRARAGSALAWLAMILALPALVLYTATAASFALLLAALRLTRGPAGR